MESRKQAVKVHPKYMIVIPKDIRRALGIMVGDIIGIRLSHQKAEIIPLRTASPEAVKRTYGMFRLPEDVDVDAMIEKAEVFLAKDMEGARHGRKALH